MFLKNNLLSRSRESYACCSTPLEIAVLWGVLHLYEGNLEKNQIRGAALATFFQNAVLLQEAIRNGFVVVQQLF